MLSNSSFVINRLFNQSYTTGTIQRTEKLSKTITFFKFPSFFYCLLSFRVTKLQKVPRKSPRHDRKSDAEGESLNKCSEFWAILFIRAGGCGVYRLVGRLRCAGSWALVCFVLRRFISARHRRPGRQGPRYGLRNCLCDLCLRADFQPPKFGRR